MKYRIRLIVIGLVIVIGAVSVAIVLPALAQQTDPRLLPSTSNNRLSAPTRLAVENAILTGLPAGGLFPFIDTTPNKIVSAHIALTDATSICAAGAAAPSSLRVLVGEAGVALVEVMSASTNTGIGSPNQCVFHVTVRPGRHGVPTRITDIVVVNGGNAPLTALQTVTVSAEVDSDNQGDHIH